MPKNPIRVLFVDDEATIRLTLPAILQMHGYVVSVAADVSEAIKAINAQTFDILISDLNIGAPGDGFTVVSAMRRIQPQCVNFILTGYPAFETALQAIRSQVDDYFVKPADITTLLERMKQRLADPHGYKPPPLQRLSEVLLNHGDIIKQRLLTEIKNHPELNLLPLQDEQRLDKLPKLVTVIAERINAGNESSYAALVSCAAEHGRARQAQGYTVPMLVEDTRIFDAVLHQLIESNLLSIDLSNLIPDMRKVNDSLQIHVKEALRAFLEEDRKKNAVAA